MNLAVVRDFSDVMIPNNRADKRKCMNINRQHASGSNLYSFYLVQCAIHAQPTFKLYHPIRDADWDTAHIPQTFNKQLIFVDAVITVKAVRFHTRHSELQSERTDQFNIIKECCSECILNWTLGLGAKWKISSWRSTRSTTFFTGLNCNGELKL